MGDAAGAHVELEATRRSGKPCQCPTCRHSRAQSGVAANLAALGDAAEEWLERDQETSMAYHYLLDEVEAVLSLDFADPETRIRLSEALRIAKPAGSLSQKGQ